MEENQNGGFTAEGRKLRPRRQRVSADQTNFGERSERVDYQPRGGERRPYDGPRGSYGEHSGERRSSYGERRSSFSDGERRSFGSHDGERRSYGEHKSFSGERRSFDGEHRNSFGGDRSRSSFSEHRSFGGERRSFAPRQDSEGGEGEQPRTNFNSERRPFSGERRSSFGEHKGFGGERRSSFSEHKSFGGERRSSFGGDRRSSFGGERRSFGPKKSFGTRKPFDDRFSFGKASEEGINNMLSRKPQVDQLQYSDNDNAPTQIQEEIRLNKFIANSGVCSRREADQYIQAGVVSVNGEIVTELGTKVNVLTDVVKFNDETLKGEEKVYIVMNKPKGFVTTASDPHAEKTVMDLLKGCKARVFPVGRLDKNTTGVLMFTNDGEIAERLTHPAYDKKKIYQVILDNPLSDEDYAKITEGIELADGLIKADELEYIEADDHRKLGIEIHSGKNRIVRRIFESLGYDVKALDRVYFAGLTKKGLKKGEWRELTEGEANVLKMGAYV